MANYNEISLITLETSVERELQKCDTFCRKMNSLSIVQNYVFGIINPLTDRAFIETGDLNYCWMGWLYIIFCAKTSEGGGVRGGAVG